MATKANKSDEAELIKQRGIIKRKLTLFKKYLQLIQGSTLTEVQLIELKNRLLDFKTIHKTFNEIQTSIELCVDLSEFTDEPDPESEQFENDYHQLVAQASQLIQQNGCSPGDLQDFPGGIKPSLIKLPQIKLPHFSGDHHDWLEYRDTFQSLINRHTTLDNIQKFHYLRSSLSGSASLVIKSLEMTGDNFEVAWKLLCERFDNKRQLIGNHVQALFNINNIHKESSVCLRQLLDTVQKNLRALATLGEKTEYWDTLIIYLVSSKFDSNTLRYWEEHKNTLTDMPSLECLNKFLKNRADLLETLEESNKLNYNSNKSDIQVKQNTKPFTKHNITSKVPACLLCKQNHQLFSCEKFRQMSIEQRIKEVQRFKICSNCLHPGHDNKSCRGGTCKYCNQKHNTLLHLNAPKPSSVTFTSCSPNKTVLLSTAQVKLFDKQGKPHIVRALLDNGSTSSYITRQLCSKLGLPMHTMDITVTGINNQCTNITKNTKIQIQSAHNSNYRTNALCLVINHISSSVPSTYIHKNNIQIPACIQLADPNFNIPAPIDLLLGADIFWQVIGTEKISLGKQQPVLQESQLGWLISGCISDNHIQNKNQNSFFVNQISENINKFWELENISTPSDITQTTQQSCEHMFTSTTTRKPDGRFVVTIPFRQSPDCLGQSYNQAKNRFLNIEKRFSSDPTYKQQYLAFMQEYLDLGHMTKNTYKSTQTPSYYIPHHGIVRNASSTTKFRVVFDASARTSNKISLNDIQTIGPVVQDDLISILIRFRQHKYIVSADIEKMYRQIEITEKQRSLQQIVFRFDESKPLDTYTLNTVTYGTASAPYLATRCIRQVGLDCQHDKEVSEIITRDFYCDDLITGCDIKSRLIDIAISVNTALKAAQFPLRKWQSNDRDILQKAHLSSDSLHSTINLGNKDLSKTLGIYWNINQDTITYSTDIGNSVDHKITKRKILSIIGKIFDPLGLLSPSVLEAKILMQKMWSLNLHWDTSVPYEIEALWKKFVQSLSALKQLVIPRRVFYDSPKQIQLHIFCDASQNAYGACVYVRTHTTNDEVHVQLLTAKCRVSPLKILTIPRLELCAALTAVRLYKKVIDSLRNSHIISNTFFWSDSMIVLSWIKLSPHKLNAFVSHRVTEIQNITQHHTWRYVPTKQNPADLISRGVTASVLIHSDLWFTGPTFLRDDETKWPTPPGHVNSYSDLPETKPEHHKHTHQCYTQTDSDSFIYKYSNFTKLTRITAYMLRFINNCREKVHRSNSASINLISLSTKELYQAKLNLVKISQLNSFSVEYELLSTNKTLSIKNRLTSLHPFFDRAGGVIRVGGRLANSRFQYDKKFPMLLHANHHICKLIFSTYHRTLLHAGPQLLLAHIRETFWPISGRNLARKTVQSCTTCRRFQGKTITPIMGNLPEPRMHSDFAFSNVGVDYAGPIMVSTRRGRGSQLIKAYICIFVCLAVKAVHLELVTDLTKESYLASLNRFISRRGKPAHIYSDNGTNFVGAANVITSFIAKNHSSITDSAAEQGITFHFIPPYTPHFGGLWESTVKSTKHHLRRVLGLAHLTYEEMYTVLCQIEGILNSRPLTPLSSDPSDLTALTPFHFLIGRSLSVLPQPLLEDQNPLRLPRYKRVELLRQHFWTRFYKEYIAQLQIRTKWRKSAGQLTEGTLVVVKDDALPPARWLLGRVTQLHPGPDGVTRVADIRTSTGTIRRAFNRICPLICGPAECL